MENLLILKKGLEKERDILFAYIFGSRATGKVHPESDLDIAVYLKEPLKDYTEKKAWINWFNKCSYRWKWNRSCYFE